MARPTLARLPKFAVLVEASGLPRAHVRGLLELMWEVANECGDPVLGSAKYVEVASGWTGEPGRWCELLAEHRWIDEVAPGLWMIHDYFDHCPRYVALRAEREKARTEQGKTLSMVRADAARKRWESETSSKRMQLENGCISQYANGATPAPAPAPAPLPVGTSTVDDGGVEGGPGGASHGPPSGRSAPKSQARPSRAAAGRRPLPLPESLAEIAVDPELLRPVPRLARCKSLGELWEARLEELPRRSWPKTAAAEGAQQEALAAIVRDCGEAAGVRSVVHAVAQAWTGFRRDWLERAGVLGASGNGAAGAPRFDRPARAGGMILSTTFAR